jgi:hypothetical protein
MQEMNLSIIIYHYTSVYVSITDTEILSETSRNITAQTYATIYFYFYFYLVKITAAKLVPKFCFILE